MDTSAECVEVSYDPQVFFARYWRQRPVYIRGAAMGFLGRGWSEADFGSAYAKALEAGSESIKERPGEVTFIEGVSRFDEGLESLATGLSKTFGAPQTWFDAIRTHTADSGIGPHFDHSDNFVLQQEGVKHWTLASPQHIAVEETERRMRNAPGVGSHPMPEGGSLHFTLRPGDLLYIPLFWLHHGISTGESLSLSLVCPAVSLYTAVIPFLARAMKDIGAGQRPIPALHANLTQEQRVAALAEIHDATRKLLLQACTDGLGSVISLQSRLLPGTQDPGHASQASNHSVGTR